MAKQCSKCKTIKPVSGFGKDATHSDGLCSICRKCKAEYARAYRQLNPGKNRNWKMLNQARVKIHNRTHYKKNSRQIYTAKQQWRKAHLEQTRKYGRQSMRRHLAIPKNRLNNQIRCAIKRSLSRSVSMGNWQKLVGYSVERLKIHLEQLFLSGMSWGNYGKWHIDHIIPISHFNFKSPGDNEFKLCWGLNNLQPLWAFDNLSKGSRVREYPK